MKSFDPLEFLNSVPGLSSAADAAVASIARAHRRPAGLRKPEVISAESLLRGARITSPDARAQHGPEISAYSVLAPELLTTTVRTFARAPLNVMATIDVAAGGEGVPHNPDRAQALARLIGSGSGVWFDRISPAVVHAEIAAFTLCGERSEVVARVCARAMAVHTGLDPRCFAVPETYLNRHARDYAQALEGYSCGDVGPALVLLMNAWEAGGHEADSIARAV